MHSSDKNTEQMNTVTGAGNAGTAVTGDKKGRRNSLIRLVIFLFLLWGISRVLSFVMMLPLGYSRTIMHESLDRDYDCIVVGSSEAMYAFDTAVFDEIRGTDSFILGTEATYLNGGEWAAFNDYMKDHKGEHAPKTVIVMQGNFEILNSGDEDPTSYSLLMPCLNNLSSKADYYVRVCKADGLWLERLLYWKDAISTDVAENVRVKLSAAYRDNGYRIEDENIQYLGKGQIRRDHVIKENVIDYTAAMPGDMEKITDYDPEVSIEDINSVYPDTLREIARICKDNDIRLITVTAPLPVTEYYDKEYYLRHLVLDQMSEELDIEFYDLNMASDSLYSPDPYGFYDNYHTNDIGARIYTESLAGLLDAVDNGEDMSGSFITWEETCHRAEKFLFGKDAD